MKHPKEWTTDDETLPPGYAYGNGDIMQRSEDLGGVRYFICDEEDLAPLEELHSGLIAGRDLSRKECAEAFKLMHSIQAPAAKKARAEGREQGREDIRAILRGLIGQDALRTIERG